MHKDEQGAVHPQLLDPLLEGPSKSHEPGADLDRRRALTDIVVAACICMAAVAYWTWDRSSTAAAAPVPIAAVPPVTPQPAATSQSSNTLNDQGAALYNAKNYPGAEALFRKAIAANPDQALGYCNLGAVLTSQGKYDEAIAALHHAVALDPSLQLAQNNLAWAIEERKKLK
jgi:tetratricopeptide (TPR) repeat protein